METKYFTNTPQYGGCFPVQFFPFLLNLSAQRIKTTVVCSLLNLSPFYPFPSFFSVIILKRTFSLRMRSSTIDSTLCTCLTRGLALCMLTCVTKVLKGRCPLLILTHLRLHRTITLPNKFLVKNKLALRSFFHVWCDGAPSSRWSIVLANDVVPRDRIRQNKPWPWKTQKTSLARPGEWPVSARQLKSILQDFIMAFR